MKYLILGTLLILATYGCTDAKQDAQTSAALPSLKLDPNNYNVAFLIMDGTFNTEFTAPWDIYHHVRFRDVGKGMNVFTVANTNEPITTFEGIKIQPDLNYLEDALPNIDILVVPSAEHHLDSDLKDEKLMDFIRSVSEDALFVTSHCDGAFVLAKAGVLDGHHCTTFPADADAMRTMFDSPIIHDSVIFVHDGKMITSAGGAKSFEASLYVCELLYGKENAQELAEGMVIDWDLNSVPHKIFYRKGTRISVPKK